MLVQDLICAEPNSIIMKFERENMIDKGFALRMIFWRVKYLCDKLLEEAHMGRFLETYIKGQQGSAVLQTITCEL